YVCAYALWTRRRGACALTYYWGITLSTQALLTPALAGPDFPSLQFLVFFASHVLVVWAAIFLSWGLRLAPSWPGYRFTVAVTACWAAATLVFNRLAGTNYGFLNAKPETGSILDLLGPWPWYLVPEVALLLLVWALMTAPWQPRTRVAGRRADQPHDSPRLR
ncbi:MAG: TIGR02206 family membrane protein, partial [Pseudonocardia sp.]|nr:TIGR02206 family membrane protein [Pseudonocardia sp.]